jgi:hypothetical protein
LAEPEAVTGQHQTVFSAAQSWPLSATGFCINKAWLAHGPIQLNRESLEHRCCIMKESKLAHNEILSLVKTYE